MANITIAVRTQITQKQFVKALTDFGPNHADIWINSQQTYLKVHSLSKTNADVTEGSNIFGGVWERLDYDWSNSNHITLTTKDSNYWKRGSSWVYKFSKDTGQSYNKLELTITRKPKTFRAFLAIVLVGIVGKLIIKKQLMTAVTKIEKL